MTTTVTLDYRVKYMRRKTMGLYVLPSGEIEVRAPKRTAHYVIQGFVDDNKSWLEERLAHCASVRSAPFLVFGRPRQLIVIIGRRRKVSLRAKTLTVSVLAGDGDTALQRQMQQWLLTVSRRYLTSRLALRQAWCRQLQVTMPTMKTRYMKSRWGSCSSRGHINLSTTLVQLPVDYCDYVIAHELSHLRVFDHSPRFYQFMALLVPNWKVMAKGIKAYPTGVEALQVSSYLQQP